MSSPSWGRTGRRATVAGAAIAAGVLPLVWADPFWLNVLTLSWIFAIAALGLTLLFGYGNQISFGHAAFVGIGAYVSALATRDLGIPVWATLIIATAAASAVGYVIARPILRLHGLALAMATLALGLAFLVVFGELPITGGPNGLAGIEPLSIGPLSLAGREAAYWGTLAIAGLAFLWSASVARSATGRALRALGAAPVGAEAIGVNTAALKCRVFAFSAGLAGLSGALLAHYTTFISSGTFDFGLSVELVIMVVIGGLRSLPGAFVGAVIVTALPAYLGAYQEYAGLIFGLLLIALFVYLPTGLAGFADRISSWIGARLAHARVQQRVAGEQRAAGGGR